MIQLAAMPFDAKEILDEDTGAVTYDRVAVSEDFAKWLSTYISNGVLVPGGDAMTSQLKVTHVSGLTLQVSAGAAAINGRTAWLDTASTLMAEPGETVPRIDRIVLELNLPEDRGVYLKVLKGVAAANPQPPALTKTADVYQISLAQFTIAANSATVTKLTDERGNNDVCGISNVTIGVRQPEGDAAENIKVSDAIMTKFGLTTSNSNVEAVLEAAPTKQKKLLAKFTSSGTFRPTDYKLPNHAPLDIFMVGGGGAGTSGRANTSYPSGGAGGEGAQCVYLQDYIVNNAANYAIQVGAGGAKGVANLNIISNDGMPGGDTVAFGHTARGGANATGTTANNSSRVGSGGGSGTDNGAGANGGYAGGDGTTGYYSNGSILRTGGIGARNNNSHGMLVGRTYFLFRNPYDGVTYSPGGAGGAAGAYNAGSTPLGGYMANSTGSFALYGGNGGIKSGVNGTDAKASNSALYGAGGSGGGGSYGGNAAYKGGNGANGVGGVVFIYG